MMVVYINWVFRLLVPKGNQFFIYLDLGSYFHFVFFEFVPIFDMSIKYPSKKNKAPSFIF